MQKDYVEHNYRGTILNLNKKELEIFKEKRGYELSITRMDQYLINEADKTEINPCDIDIKKIASQFTPKQMEEIINDYIRIENETWK